MTEKRLHGLERKYLNRMLLDFANNAQPNIHLHRIQTPKIFILL
jgi:hypothetical protein